VKRSTIYASVMLVVAALLVYAGTAVWRSHVQPRRILQERLNLSAMAVRVLAMDDNVSVRGGSVTWTLAITDGGERALQDRCKIAGSFRKIYAAPVLTTATPQIRGAEMKATAATPAVCLLVEWPASDEASGGEIVLLSNMLQLTMWSD
jgi:hypothetical protein